MNRTMLARAWASGAGPSGGMVTVDPDATLVDTYGPDKEGSKFSYRGEVGLSPLIGVCGETGDVLAIRARSGDAHPGRDNAGFIRECVSAIPGRSGKQRTCGSVSIPPATNTPCSTPSRRWVGCSP